MLEERVGQRRLWASALAWGRPRTLDLLGAWYEKDVRNRYQAVCKSFSRAV